jgi:FlaA1/EpsC-like NDP-sugar epimerase
MFLPKANTPRWIISLLDLLISLFSLAFAYLIRFDLKANETLIRTEWEILAKSLPIYILIKWFVFNRFQVQKGLIRHTSTEDLKRIFYAISTSTGLFLVLGILRWKYYDGFFLFPSSVLVMEFFISFFLVSIVRFIIKLMYLESVKNKEIKKRVVIYGAGVSGLITKRTIEKDSLISYEIIAFLDDNKKLKGTRLEGISIFHSSSLEKLIQEEGVSELIIAIQHPDALKRQEVVEICLKNRVEVKQVPSATRWINGEFSTKQINAIKIEDLLGRKPIVLNVDLISKELKGKVILITGAAGSIGSGIVRQIAGYAPKELVLLDNAESPMYDFQQELKHSFPGINFTFVIGDIRLADRMRHVFECLKPTFVFHSAAYKHVPLMEDNPSEALATNVGGTKNLVDLSLEFGVEKFVMISTDKAVNPTNVMGASKRIAEIYAQSKNGKHTKFITTRFGNVLGSNGSVIPLFKKQIEQGGPITVTDANVTRFFMTIPEACQLVLEAATMGQGGEIFVFDMGESVKIIDLARKMILLSGLEEGKDIEIKVTGLRPGEKLYEELLASDENTIPTHHPQILVAKVRPMEEEKVNNILELIPLFTFQNNDLIVQKMKEIVPEYISNNSEFSKFDLK